MQIIQHTPTWVWVILVFVLYRGLYALRDHYISLPKLFIMPIVFLVLGVVSLEKVMFFPASIGFALCLMAGIFIMQSTKPKAAASYDAKTAQILRPGSPFSLVLVLSIFIFKFSISAFLAHQPQLTHNLMFSIIWGAGSGFLTGLFWGNLFVLFKSINKPRTI